MFDFGDCIIVLLYNLVWNLSFVLVLNILFVFSSIIAW